MDHVLIVKVMLLLLMMMICSFFLLRRHVSPQIPIGHECSTSQGEFLREMELDAVDHSVSPRRGKVISRIFAQGSIMINLSPPTGGASSVVH